MVVDMKTHNLKNMEQRLIALLVYLNDYKHEDLYLIGQVAALLETTKAIIISDGD